MEQLLQQEGFVVYFDPWGSRTKSQSSKSQVGGRWKVGKTQERLKVEVEKSLKEEGDIDREENGDGIQ